MWTTEIYVVRTTYTSVVQTTSNISDDSDDLLGLYSLGIGLELKSSCGLVLAKTPKKKHHESNLSIRLRSIKRNRVNSKDLSNFTPAYTNTKGPVPGSAPDHSWPSIFQNAILLILHRNTQNVVVGQTFSKQICYFPCALDLKDETNHLAPKRTSLSSLFSCDHHSLYRVELVVIEERVMVMNFT
ncbi:hypothetical protein YC2023_097901 [Brassica napus]